MQRILFAALILGVTGCGKANLTQDCTMNGFGQGSCSFTNKGDAKGAVCGHIEVSDGEKSEESSDFCSGEVGKQSTSKVDFSVPGVRTLCAGGGSWIENCDFTFVVSK